MGIVAALIATPALAEFESQEYYSAGVLATSYSGLEISYSSSIEDSINSGNLIIDQNDEDGITNVEWNMSNSGIPAASVEFGCAITDPDTAFGSAKDYWMMHTGLDSIDSPSVSDIQVVITDRRDRSEGADFHAAVACWADALLDDVYWEDIESNMTSYSSFSSMNDLAIEYLSETHMTIPYTFIDAAYSQGIDLAYFYEAWARGNSTEEGRAYLKTLIDQWNQIVGFELPDAWRYDNSAGNVTDPRNNAFMNGSLAGAFFVNAVDYIVVEINGTDYYYRYSTNPDYPGVILMGALEAMSADEVRNQNAADFEASVSDYL